MNIIEITEKFPTELHAIKFFERIRWGKKPKCPYCNSIKIAKRGKDFRFHCNNCNKSFSVTTQTSLHNTRLPLRTWLYAIALITDAKKGMSAKQLERNIGVHYETAWKMYMKLRELMVEPIPKLKKIVEMDETYTGGKPRYSPDYCDLSPKKQAELDKKIEMLKKKGVKFSKGKAKPKQCSRNVKRGRGTTKIPIVGITQRDGNVIAQVMKKLTSNNLKKMVEKYVKKEEATIITDDYKGYKKLDNIIKHITIEHKKKVYSYKGVNTNTIESFWAIIKRGIMGQYHKVSPKYLPDYINEFVFKFNNRNQDDMFQTLVANTMRKRQLTKIPTNR